jgi:hypothetical protein
MSAWQTMATAPRDGGLIQAWHRVWKCPVSIRYKPHLREDCPWLEATHTTVWPEDAFTHWTTLSEPPQ